MRISGTRIRNLYHHLAALPPGTSFRLNAEADEKGLARLGLPASPGNGETILPRMIGPVTRFNAEGRWLTRRDLPKENRYIRTVRWRWTTWNNEEHEDFKPIFRECYQRELIDPPAIELTYVEQAGERLVTSPVMRLDPTQDAVALHSINLFLEIFGSCEIVTDNFEKLSPPTIKKANWRFLPPGKHPWNSIEEHIRQIAPAANDDARAVILDRQKTIESFSPVERWVGEGGFMDYMAYVFENPGFVVLESIRRGNAIYVFKGDWRKISQLSKAEIIKEGLAHARVVHSDKWKQRLGELFHKRAA